MARTKQTARKSTGGYPHRRLTSIPYQNPEAIKTFNAQLEKALKRNINDEFSWSNYENIPEIVKLWIIQDQRRQASSTHDLLNEKQLTTISSDLLQSLPQDLKYEIIDFLPTFSMVEVYKSKIEEFTSKMETSGLTNEEFNSRIANCFNPIYIMNSRREFEQTHRLDSNFQTFHKMRLINREYASRMKLRILKSSNIDLSNLSFEKEIVYFLDFLKEQTLFEQGLIDLSDPIIYQHVDAIKSLLFSPLPEKKKNSFFDFDGEEKSTQGNNEEETLKKKRTLDEIINLSDEQVENLISELTEKDNVSDGTVLPRKKKQSKVSHHFRDATKDDRDYKKEFYSFLVPLELPGAQRLYKQKRDRQVISLELEKLIEENTKLEILKISVSNDVIMETIATLCKGLKKLTLVNQHNYLECYPEIFSKMTHLEEFELFDTYSGCLCGDSELLEFIPKNCKVVCTFLDDIESIACDKQHVIYLDGGVYADSYPNTTDKLHIYVNNKINSIEEFINQHLQYSYFRSRRDFLAQDLRTRSAAMEKKQFCDHVRDHSIPVEELPLSFLDENTTAYLIYIANTYQGGRMPQGDYKNIEKWFEYGWIPTNLDEMILTLDWKSVEIYIDLFKSKMERNDFIVLMRTLLINSLFCDNSISLYPLFKYIKALVNQEELKKIMAPVDNIIASQEMVQAFGRSIISLPLIYLPFDNYQFAMELIDEMTPEELEQQNALGDTCLHLQLRHSNEVIEKIIEKQPKLTKILNSEQRNILHFLARDENRYPIVLKLITKYGIDYLQPDSQGKTPLESENGNRIYEYCPENGVLIKFEQ